MPLERGKRRDPHQVPQSLRVGRQQRLVQVRARRGHVAAAPGGLVGLALVLLAPVDRLPVQPGHGRDVRLDPDDGREPGAGDGLLELVGAEHVPVVGHRQGRHPQLLGPPGQLGDLRGTVEHRVLGVDMQVHERIAGHVILLETPPADNPTLVPGTVIRGLVTARRAGLVEHTAAPADRARPPGQAAAARLGEACRLRQRQVARSALGPDPRSGAGHRPSVLTVTTLNKPDGDRGHRGHFGSRGAPSGTR